MSNGSIRATTVGDRCDEISARPTQYVSANSLLLRARGVARRDEAPRRAAAVLLAMREAAVERYLVEQVESRGALCEKIKVPRYCGMPDRTVSWPGGILHFVETKTVGGKLSVRQKRDHAKRRKLGFYVVVIWTKKQVDDYECYCRNLWRS